MKQPDSEALLGTRPSSARRNWRWPRIRDFSYFSIHFLFSIGVVAFVLLCVDGHDFNIVARLPSIMEPDGSIHRTRTFTLLQSDITTILAFAATTARFISGLWSAGLVWRCVFFLMERGIPLGVVEWVLNSWPPLPRNKPLLVVAAVILSTFVLNTSSPILTGSITWTPSFNHVPGTQPLNGIPVGASVGLYQLENYRDYPENVQGAIIQSSAIANFAWSDINGTSVGTMRRVLRSPANLTTMSTLTNVTLPYFAVDAFKWIKEPNAVLTEAQKKIIILRTIQGPFFIAGDHLGLLPDTDHWGPGLDRTFAEPHIVDETRILIIRTEKTTLKDPRSYNCSYSAPDFGTIPREAGFYTTRDGTSFFHCYIAAEVRYRAGVAECKSCLVRSRNVLENTAPLTLKPDPLTREALALVPAVTTHMRLGNASIPAFRNNVQNYSIEMLSRAYQASWTILTTEFSSDSASAQLTTDIMIAVPTTRANVMKSRVYLWLIISVFALFSGLVLFVYQQDCRHPWMSDPRMAGLLMDTRDIIADESWEEDKDNPWKPGPEYPPMECLQCCSSERKRLIVLKYRENRGILQ